MIQFPKMSHGTLDEIKLAKMNCKSNLTNHSKIQRFRLNLETIAPLSCKAANIQFVIIMMSFKFEFRRSLRYGRLEDDIWKICLNYDL